MKYIIVTLGIAVLALPSAFATADEMTSSSDSLVWYFDNADPTLVWGSDLQFWERMDAGPLPDCVSEDLDSSYAFYAATYPIDADYSYHRFFAKIWLDNNWDDTQEPVTAELRVGGWGNEGFLLSSASVVVTNDMIVGMQGQPYLFDFGTIDDLVLYDECLIVKIIYYDDAGNTHIHWDGEDCPSALRALPPDSIGADTVLCEPQGGANPSHPTTYWYDLTPGGALGRCDFHVQVHDPNPANYSNPSLPAPTWQFAVHKVNDEWWASWWDPDCLNAIRDTTFRFKFDNDNPSTWGHWTSTIGASSNPHLCAVDFSGHHFSQPNGHGYRVHVPTESDDMIGYWRFEEGSGSIAYDETANNNDGTIRTASWTSSPVCDSGSALFFHGGCQFCDGDRVLVPHSPSLDITGRLTVSAWIKATGTDHYYTIVDKYHSSQGAPSYGFTLYLTEGRIRLSIYSGPNGSEDLCIGTTDLRDSKWHHVAGTWDGDSIKTFVDGKRERAKAWSFPPASTSNHLGIGLRVYGWGGYMPFCGKIDEVRIYSRALSIGEIQTLQSLCAPCDCTPGDCDGSGIIDVDDVVCLVNFVFSNGTPPTPYELCSGDADCSCVTDIDDVVYLVEHVFVGGPAPCDCTEWRDACGSPLRVSIDGDGSFAQTAGKGELGKAIVGNANLSTVVSKTARKTSALVSIDADRDVQAMQLEYEIHGDVNNVEIESRVGGIADFHSVRDGILRIGLLDPRGEVMIPAGMTEIASISYVGDGNIEFAEAVVVAKGGGRLMPDTRQRIDVAIPQSYALHQNWPNPFNATTSIDYELPKNAHAKIDIFNVMGQRVITLIDRYEQAGAHSIEWNGCDESGGVVASGIYLYRLTSGDFTSGKKMVLMK